MEYGYIRDCIQSYLKNFSWFSIFEQQILQQMKRMMPDYNFVTMTVTYRSFEYF